VTGSIRRLLALGMGVAILGAACTATATPTASPTSGGACTGSFDKPAEIRLGFQQVPNGDIIVKQSGWLEADLAGVKVTWLPFNSGGEVNQAITANGIDIGLAGSSPVSRGIANGIPYAVPWIFDVIGAAEALAVRKTANIKTPADLVGKKIGVPFVSTTHYSLLSYLTVSNVDRSKVELLNMSPPDAVAAWKTGQIDAAYIWEPALSELMNDGGEALVDSAKMAELGYPTFDFAVVRNDFAQKYPCVMNIWAAAQERAVQLYKSDPDKATGLVAKEFGIDGATAKRQMAGLVLLTASEQASTKWLGGDLLAAIKQTAQYLLDQKEIDKMPDDATLRAAVVKDYAAAAVK